MKVWHQLFDTLQKHGRAAMISVAEVNGSTPREPGARMVIASDGTFRGTIGGGTLEWQAIADARRALGDGAGASLNHIVLGPDMGQCCGGTLKLLVEVFDEDSVASVRELAFESRLGLAVISEN